MKLSRFEGRSIGLAGLTTGGVGKAWKAIADKMFAESYILYYGFPQKKIITKTKVFYVDPPLIRGKAIKVATRLVRQSVIAIVNAGSNLLAAIASRLGAAVASISLLTLQLTFIVSFIGRLVTHIIAKRIVVEV
jgi:hypothetical protein